MSQYFFRTVVYSSQQDQVSLINIMNPNEEPTVLEAWLGIVVVLADGQHTVQDLIEYLAEQYEGAPPMNLDKTIESVIERLLDSAVIKLTDEPVTLPYYLSQPIERLDVEKAKRMMGEDGYPV